MHHIAVKKMTNLKPIDDGNSDFDLVVTRKIDGTRYMRDEVTTIEVDEVRYVPHCRLHGAMLKVSVGGIWRCIRATSLQTGKVINDCRAGCIETIEGGIKMSEMTEMSLNFLDHVGQRWKEQNIDKLTDIYKLYLTNLSKSSDFNPDTVETFKEFVDKEHSLAFKRECFRCQNINTSIKETHCQKCGLPLLKDMLVTELIFKLPKKQQRMVIGLIDIAYPELESKRLESAPEVEDDGNKETTEQER